MKPCLMLGLIALAPLPAWAVEVTAPGGGVTLTVDAEMGVARGLTAGEMSARGVGGVEVTDHTPAPLAEPEALPEALRGLYLPQGALDGLKTAFEAAEGPVRRVSIGWLGGDRYLWRIELAEPLPDDGLLTLYLNTDDDPTSGRQDLAGPEVTLQVGPGQQRQYRYMPEGRAMRAREMYAALDGPTVWLTCDEALKPTPNGVIARFWITAPGGGIPEQRIELPLGRAEPLAMAEPEPLQTLAAELAWQRRSEDGEVLLAEHLLPREGYLSWLLTAQNTGERDRWVDLQCALPIEFGGQWRLFDAFNFTPHESPAADTIYAGLSAMLPLTCAWDGRTGIALALDPWCRFSELHAGARVREDTHLLLGSRLCISPGESDELRFVIFSFDGALGWRGAFSRFWQLFPDAYDRPRDIDPRFHLTSSAGLYWAHTDPADEAFAPDLIRRLQAGWAWGYAPAPRPGAWAVGEEAIGEWTRSHGTVKKSLSAEGLVEFQQGLRERCDGDKAGVAVAYYMHLKSVEQNLTNRYFADSHTNDEPTEYYGYYQFVPCFELYPGHDGWGNYMREALPTIAERFNPAGMAFDSVFGFIPEYSQVTRLDPTTSFENGRFFVCEGIGWSILQDIIREQHTRGYRTAMVTNLKLPTLSANAVRTDSALIEHGPNEVAGYRERFLRLRMMSGRINFTWWHTLDPNNYKWMPWDQLNTEQTLDAFRRLRDDLLIHSMYYGALPNAHYLVGLPKLIKAMPMMTDIFDLGWEPVIAAQSAHPDLLISRYGSGLGMCYGLGNQSYRNIEDGIAVDLPRVSENEDLVYMDYSGAPTTTTFADGTAQVSVKVEPRNVGAVRAVLGISPGVVEEVTVEALMGHYGRGGEPGLEAWPGGRMPQWTHWGLRYTFKCRQSAKVQLRFWQPGGALGCSLLNEEATSEWETPEHVFTTYPRLSTHGNTITLVWHPALQGLETEALADFPFVKDGKPNCNIVAAEGHRDSAMRVQHFFREYYRWATDTPADVRLPIITPGQDTGGRRVWIGVQEDLPEGLSVKPKGCLAAFGVEGNTVYAVAYRDELVDDTVLALLETLEEKYPYWGQLAVRHYHFRDDLAGEVPALIEAGVAGGVLEGEESGNLPGVEDFPKLIVWP